MDMKPYLVTINGRHTVRVFAYDASGAALRGSTVYRYTCNDPEPCASVSSEADLKSAAVIAAARDIEPAPRVFVPAVRPARSMFCKHGYALPDGRCKREVCE